MTTPLNLFGNHPTGDCEPTISPLQTFIAHAPAETQIYIWYGFNYPFHITTKNITPHRNGKSLTLLEYYRRQLKNDFTSKLLTTRPTITPFIPSQETRNLILALNSDLVTLGFLMFSDEGLPYQLIQDSSLETVKQLIPHLTELSMHGYKELSTNLLDKANKVLLKAIRSRETVAKSRNV